jgi:2-methylisocitrate lyase-like PEP mutase family enzyme
VDQEQVRKASVFSELHGGPPFIIPNPWDAGSARVLESLGFKALATTSSGFAFTLGRPDGPVSLPEVVAHVRALCEATSVPLSVDLENGYGPAVEDVAHAVRQVAAAGAVAASIEDWDADGGIYDVDRAAERVAAACEAARGLGFDFMVTARAENHIRGNPDLADTIARLQAYERSGADVLYAPGLRTLEEIRSVCEAVSRPVNVLAAGGLRADEIFAQGAQRISVGGALTWAAAEAMIAAARALRETGETEGLRGGGNVAAALR